MDVQGAVTLRQRSENDPRLVHGRPGEAPLRSTIVDIEFIEGIRDGS
jgi:hypothetical protein